MTQHNMDHHALAAQTNLGLHGRLNLHAVGPLACNGHHEKANLGMAMAAGNT